MLQIELFQICKSVQISELLFFWNLIPFQIKHCQMLAKWNIEKIVYFVEAYVEFLKLLKGLNSLKFSDFAPGHVQNPHIFKWRADVAEAPDHGIIELEDLKAAQNFAGDL